MSSSLIAVSHVYKSVTDATGTLDILRDIDFSLNAQQTLAIVGASGSGKSTLLAIMAGLDTPTQGTVHIAGQDLFLLDEDQRAALRAKHIGFVFQSFNLIAPLNALDNVMMPLQLKKLPRNIAKQKALAALELVGMMDRKNNLPKQLSGGQQQRVAIARALVTDPKLVLCDEPTASLDANSITTVMQELVNLAKNGKAVCVVTHDPRLLQYADRIIEVEAGRAKEISKSDISQKLAIH